MDLSPFTTAMVEEARKQGGASYYYSVVTIEPPRDGELICHIEETGLRPGNAAHDSYSVAKSVASMAAGILFDRGLLRMDDTLGRYLGDYLISGTDRRWGDLTIHQLLRHRTGAATGVDFDLTNAHEWSDPEWLHTLFAAPIRHVPESKFVYSDGNYYILGRIVERLCGMDLESFLQKEVFVPLGFHVNAWSRDINGHTVGGTGLYIRTRDLAKIAWLWQSEGMWGEHRVYSKAWSDCFLHYVKDSVADYGYGITRVAPTIWMAGGMYGQGLCFDTTTHRAVAYHCYDPSGHTRGLGEAFCTYCATTPQASL